MSFDDKDFEELAVLRNSIGGLKTIMMGLSYTGNGIPMKAHVLLEELEQRAYFLELREGMRSLNG